MLLWVILAILVFAALVACAVAFSCKHKWKETSHYEIERGREKTRVTLYHCEKCGNPKEERTKL